MIHELLNTALGPLKVKFWLGIVAALGVLAFAAIKIADNRDKRMIETAQESGASSAVVEGQRDVLEQVERAQNADNEINSGDRTARYERCLRNSSEASRANCERFRPVSD